MRKLALVLLTIGLWLPLGGQAADMKIGVVDNIRLFTEAPQAIEANRRIMEKFRPLEQKLLDKQKNIKAQDERLQRDGAIMSAAEREKLQRDLKKAVRELQLEDAQLKEDFTAAQQKEQAKLKALLMEAIQELAQEEGYDLVLYDGVSYAAPGMNITDKVLERLKAK